ncbi:head GIN domain-containing protein [Flavobacterium sp. K5-23]|uniref:head GIN domain-containing protein n=1 Tax=Flavobacterium sp. K5-23 TaxID=2746225 RepID=UPI00200F2186|nr:head GIN domain-containing protein [Flavobacterium sp. K5-23]UQD56256.1 DUF2807 domain-containing protein [Flavobacterium sp. K5-23]
MLKIITVITKFIVVAITALLFASCNQSFNLKKIKGSGNVTTEKRTVNSDFQSIEVSNAIDLVVEQANHTEVIVEADDNLQNSITTKVENGILIISSDHSSFYNVKSKKVTVKMPVIEELKASSSSTIRSENTLKGENISLRASSAATINVQVNADNTICKSSSGSDIAIEGLALNFEATASSGSEIDASDFQVNDVIAKSSSGSSIKVNPIVSLNARASSGSTINYKNTPKSIEKKSSSGASIDKI